MAAPTRTSSAFSQYLKGLNRQQARGGAVASGEQAAILKVLADGPRSFGHLAKLSGVPLNALMAEVERMREFGLLRQLKEEDRVVVELTPDGRDLLNAAG
jgi:DNA-binding HxlR family transcriptional regulator